MSLAVSLPAKAIVLPPNVRVSSVGGTMVFQKIKRRIKRFKMSKKQRQKIAASARKFKIPILTGISIAPAVLFSAQAAMQQAGLLNQMTKFAIDMISYYTGVRMFLDGSGFNFDARRLAVGWGPLVGVAAVKVIAKGRLMAINRALSQAQLPIRAS